MRYYKIGVINYEGYENICIYHYDKEIPYNCKIVEIDYRNKLCIGYVLTEVSKPTFETKSLKVLKKYKNF